MKTTPRVTIAIPTFHGEEFIAGAIESLTAQTFHDFKAVMSVDGGDEKSAAICRSFEGDPRFRVVVQPERLGFAVNFNWLVQQLDTEFFIFLGQDDRLDPRCIEILVAEADLHPDALVVYSDLKWFGGLDYVQYQSEIRGTTPFDRVVSQLQRGHWHALHGLVRAKTLKLAGPLVADSPDNVFEDIVWLTKVMRLGWARRIPTALYLKRFHAESVTGKQLKWPPTRVRSAWLHAWWHLLEAGLPAAQDQREVRRILQVVLKRVVLEAPDMAWFFDLARLDQNERRELLVDFLEYVQKKGTTNLPMLIGMDWHDIRRWSRRKTRGESTLRKQLRPVYRRFRQLWDERYRS